MIPQKIISNGKMTYYADHANEYAGKWVDGYFEKKNN